MNLTKSQWTMLRSLDEVTCEHAFANVAFGPRAHATFRKLESLGLVVATRRLWKITDAGRAAVAKLKGPSTTSNGQTGGGE